MKFHITTFGCQMNVHDSQWLARALESRGWEETGDEDAQVYILNTCSVRDKPEQKVYSELGRVAAHLKRDESVFAAVGGCVAQQVGRGFFERFPFVKLVFGSDGIAGAPNALERIAAGKEERAALLDFVTLYEEREQPDAPVIADETRQAFVNIMQGCDNFCAYCIVPYTRGRQKSRTPDAILDECRALVDGGVREITLLGQNVNSFGLDKGGVGVSFAELLRSVAAIPGVDRLRFTTSHPKDIAEGGHPGLRRAAEPLPVPPPAHAGRVGQRAQGHAPQVRHEALPFHRGRPARCQAGHQSDHGPHRRLSRRDRGGLSTDPGHGRAGRFRVEFFLQVFRPARGVRP